MQTINSFKTKIFHVNNQNFAHYALQLFHFQSQHNQTYRDYLQHLNINPEEVNDIIKIPFLPIRFFKHHEIKSGKFKARIIFESSGTTGFRSKHYIEDTEFYKSVSQHIFTSFFGDIRNAVVIGLLPSYLERGNSSLVFMVDHFVQLSANEHSGFYLGNMDELYEKLEHLAYGKSPVFLFGVTFALLDFIDKYRLSMDNLYILETGGMKGRGKELTREELHRKLRKGF